MTTLAIALRLAFSRDIRQRWRQVSIALASFLAVSAALLGAGLIHAADVAQKNRALRQPSYAESPEAEVVRLAMTGPIFGNRQIPVVWLEPTQGHERDPKAVPRGLRSIPEPGTAVVSPGLARVGLSAKDFGLKLSRAGSGPGGVIGNSGLESHSELRVYARPAAGRDLGTSDTVISASGFGLTRVTGPSSRPFQLIETDPEMITRPEALLPSLILILTPLIYLLFGAGRAMSPVRQERAESLWAFGVSRWNIRKILALETASLCLCGLIPGILVWLLVLKRLTEMPISETVMLPGALILPWWVIVGVILATVALPVLSAVASPIPAKKRLEKTVRRQLRATPLLAGLLLLFANPILPVAQTAKSNYLMLSLFTVLISLPYSLVALVQILGPGLERLPRGLVWLAARRLASASGHLTRPAALVGALILISGSSLGIYQAINLRTKSDSRVTDSYEMYDVFWLGSRPGDVQRAAGLLSGDLVLPISPEEKDQKVYFPNCVEVDRVGKLFTVPGCLKNGMMSPEFRQAFQVRTRQLPGISTKIPAETSAILVFRFSRGGDLAINRALSAALPAVNVTPINGNYSANIRFGWLMFYWTFGSCLLFVALVRELGDRGLLAVAGSTVLRRVSFTEVEIARVNRWTLFLPVLIAAPIGYLAAILFTTSGSLLEMTSLAGLLITAGTAAVLLGTLAVFLVVLQLAARMERASLPG